jgi:hypothetical protein
MIRRCARSAGNDDASFLGTERGNPQGQQTAQSPGNQAPSGQPPIGQDPLAQMPPLNALAAAPAAPEERCGWREPSMRSMPPCMYRRPLPPLSSDPQGQPTQSAQGQPGQPQPGQPQNAAAQAMAQAQAAMNAAAQAAANSMRSARAETPAQMPSGIDPKSDQQAKSQNGALAQAPCKAYQSPAEARNLKAGEWGKLPKQVAEQLTQGQREAVAGEYRNQIETYYRVMRNGQKSREEVWLPSFRAPVFAGFCAAPRDKLGARCGSRR